MKTTLVYAPSPAALTPEPSTRLAPISEIRVIEDSDATRVGSEPSFRWETGENVAQALRLLSPPHPMKGTLQGYSPRPTVPVAPVARVPPSAARPPLVIEDAAEKVAEKVAENVVENVGLPASKQEHHHSTRSVVLAPTTRQASVTVVNGPVAVTLSASRLGALSRRLVVAVAGLAAVVAGLWIGASVGS